MNQREGKILHLTLKKKWFDLVKSGKKNYEYREYKRYWVKRLYDKNGHPKIFDIVRFKNGYGKDAPTIDREWHGVFIASRPQLNKPDNGEILSAWNIVIVLGPKLKEKP